ncbi:hypothetical protein SBRCBS47491_010122 [Sporothrix bragantina]|uniref:Modin n=1 Tax=Sporothrix bragantina TaxID=671064 RepID=A0ABP0D2W5_9PEZI
MSSNTGDSSSTGNNANNNGGGGNSDTIIAIVALVVSVIALIGTGLQVVQQYMASAAGYSNCDAAVIGPWHTSKKRRFRLSEMRFQVLFETPVFFVCPASNKNGPIKDAPIHFVKGDQPSIEHTRSLPLPDLDPDGEKKKQEVDGKNGATTMGPAGPVGVHGANASMFSWSKPKLKQKLLDRGGVHTADNEMSTWVRLLQELHRMERDSLHWQENQIQRNTPAAASAFDDHKLCVALQAKKRSWDTMPASISRPYAASTICHMVEMAAMLGIYWKEFDRSTGCYRAEGNGYFLTGSHVPDLGIVFTFQICGKSQFAENRIIPADEVKELAFGIVPTIFREKEDLRRVALSTDDTCSPGKLWLGSRNELAETLASIGCNTNTSNCLRDENKKHGHLFPLAFEITGMLGRTLHFKTSVFRFLPNPTFYHWDRKYFSMRRLLQGYQSEIADLESNEPQIRQLKTLAKRIVDSLVAKPKQQGDGAAAAEDAINRSLMTELHETLDQCDVFLRNKQRQNVELVLREHVQELLRMVNNEGDYGASNADVSGIGAKIGSGANTGESIQGLDMGADKAKREATLCFDDVMAASPEVRQKTLMKIYFSRLLPRVAKQAAEASQQHIDGAGASTRDNLVDGSPLLEPTSVWCTLVFRMLCWLSLHDFNKMDVQISKSELVGNRLPVYIW